MTDEERIPADDLAFGDGVAELEAIVASLESGELDLEESLSKYERGVALLKILQGKLSDAQQRVTVLLGELESEADENEPS